MRRLREQFPNELVVIGVHSAKFPSEQLTANIREAVRRHEIEHPVVNDADFTIWNSYAVRAWPTLILIDPEGYVAGSVSGEIRAEDLAPAIESLIAEAERNGTLDRRPLDIPMEASQPERPLSYPSKVLAPGDGRLFIADTGHHRVLEVRLSPDGGAGEVVRIVGSGEVALRDGPADEAAFHGPHGMALSGGSLYVADTENHAVRAVDLGTGVVRTVAGTGEKAHGAPVPAAPAETPLRSPWALHAADGVLFIAMAGSHQIWALVNDERLGPFAGSGREALVDGPRDDASFNQPSDLAAGWGYLFVADAEASAIRAISLNAEPTVMTLAGQGLFEFGDVDGVGAEVRLQHPTGIAFADDRLYIADSYNHKIKHLDLASGRVETFIGSGDAGDANGPFESAQLYEPEGLSIADGHIYIADTNNHLIRVADLDTGYLRTLVLSGV